MMYTITRQEASEILGVSTRSVDRYIKSGKIRAKKVGKQVLLNELDIKNLSGDGVVKQKIIIETPENKKEKELQENIILQENINKKDDGGLIKKSDYEKVLATFEKMYTGFREEIKQKDQKIEELSLQLGRVLEQKENTVDLMEYKKVKFLSEENKKTLLEKLEEEQKNKEKILKDLKYEKTTNKLLIFFLIILIITSVVVFFLQI